MNFTYKDNIIKTDERQFDFNVGIGEALFELMQFHSDKTAQINVNTEESDTYESLLKKSIRTALELQNRNIKKGDVVAIFCCSHVDTCIPITAAYFIGAVPFVMHVVYPSVWDTIIGLKPKAIFADEASRKAIETFLINNKGEIEPDLAFFGSTFEKQFLNPHPEENQFKPIHTDDLNETITILYSAGTTAGIPKLIFLRHYNLIKSLHGKPYGKPIVRLGSVAWSWIGGIVYYLYAANNGDCRILCDNFYGIIKTGFEVESLWKIIEKYKVEYLLVNPLLVRSIFNVDKIDYDVSSLKIYAAGGSPLLENYYPKIQSLFPNALPINTYGGTEFGGPFGFNFHDKEQLALYKEEVQSVGLPLNGYWYKIVNPETEETVGPYEIGELRLKSKYLLAKGYSNIEEWNQNFDSNGWFKTGDLVYYDSKFRFFVKDRLKFIIISNGYRVFPAYLESILIKYPKIKEVAVIGAPNENEESAMVQNPMAVVVLKEGENSTPEEIMSFFVKQLPPNSSYNNLTGGVKIVKKLPVTPIGKIMKLNLKQMIIDNEL